MLEGLEQVDWPSLSHAYGPAEDVPDLIRDLASWNPKERKQAIYALYGNIWHQGTVYQATSYAVPFLIELLEEPSVQGKAAILRLLEAISRGSSYHDAHQDMEWYRHERQTEEFQETLAEELYWVAKAQEAVSAGASVYLELLREQKTAIAIAALYVLANCVHEYTLVEPKLRHLLDDPSLNSTTKACVLWAWLKLRRYARHSKRVAGVSRAEERHLLESRLRSSSESSLVRLLAGLGLLSYLQEKSYPRLTQFLAHALAINHQRMRFIPWCDGEAMGFIYNSLGSQQTLVLDLFCHVAKSSDHPFCSSAVYYLEQIAMDQRSARGPIAQLLGQLLGSPNPDVRRTAVRQLLSLGRSLALAQEPLRQALQDTDPDVAKDAVLALCQIRDEQVIPHLVQLLASGQNEDRILRGVQKFGAKAKDAIPYLRQFVRETKGNSRVISAHALASMGEASLEALQDVTNFLGEGLEAAGATWALMLWGQLARPALPILLHFLSQKNNDRYARVNGIKAIESMGAYEEARSLLLDLLDDPDTVVRVTAAGLIWKQSPQESKAISVLADVLEKPLENPQAIHSIVHVLEVLESIGPDARRFANSIRKYLDDTYQWARVRAARALWRMGEPVADFLPLLIDELRCRPVGILAAECLAEIGPAAAAAWPRLQQLLSCQTGFNEGGFYGEIIDQEETFLDAVTKAIQAIEGNEKLSVLVHE